MGKVLSNYKYLIALSILCIMILGAFLPAIQALDVEHITGFDKGLSYTSVVPMKKVTFVNFDDETLVDDYAYLAAVPTAIFENENKLFSHPLLFYQDEYEPDDEKELSLNARSGIDYFMEDWEDYCYRLDQMTLINVPKNKVDHWKSNDLITIESDNPFDIASDIAFQDWAYSDKAVIAVIEEEFNELDEITTIIEKGTLSSGKEIITKTFYTKQLDKLNPRFHMFEIPEGYKFIKTRTWWASFWVGTREKSAFPLHINMTIPAADPDSQLYCKFDDEWMQVAELPEGLVVGRLPSLFNFCTKELRNTMSRVSTYHWMKILRM